jgi:hypothetical protein
MIRKPNRSIVYLKIQIKFSQQIFLPAGDMDQIKLPSYNAYVF